MSQSDSGFPASDAPQPSLEPPGDIGASRIAARGGQQGLVELLAHLAMLSLLKIRLCNHLNKEQDMTLEVERVCEVSSFLLRTVDPGKIIS